MKLLLCPKCGPRGASLPKSPAYPNGEPYTSAGWVPRYSCAKCKVTQTLSKPQWNSIPDLSLADFNRLAKEYAAPSLSDLPLKDAIGAGFTKDQAEALFEVGQHDMSDDLENRGQERQ